MYVPDLMNKKHLRPGPHYNATDYKIRLIFTCTRSVVKLVNSYFHEIIARICAVKIKKNNNNNKEIKKLMSPFPVTVHYASSESRFVHYGFTIWRPLLIILTRLCTGCFFFFFIILCEVCYSVFRRIFVICVSFCLETFGTHKSANILRLTIYSL